MTADVKRLARRVRVVGLVAMITLANGIFVTAASAYADELPRRKAGLWQVTMATGTDAGQTHEITMCIDAATDAELQKLGLTTSKEACTRNDIKRDGDVITVDADCQLGKRHMTSHAVTTFSGDTSYHTDIQTHTEPPIAGPADHTMTQDAKWTGECPANMQAGDVVFPGGRTVNIRSMPGSKK